ncbi:hypothetical protein [Nostoc sphaeroides]|uniref:Uncharacterized protein n=1 Tax=Nostoc sphaeroides CCNUC1 TaxID=2653204 RepID=A0A5P8VVX6_9NOSO|nr:hypothetical protein [Nostoc sphaeroides]QFS44573.1 hypothetical protein GXM_02048 [Nostoc sphaeroides CCNUC1]
MIGVSNSIGKFTKLIIECLNKAIVYSSTIDDRIVFEVFCKAIAHSWTTGDRLIFEVFCKAIPTVSFANAVTLPYRRSLNF